MNALWEPIIRQEKFIWVLSGLDLPLLTRSASQVRSSAVQTCQNNTGCTSLCVYALTQCIKGAQFDLKPTRWSVLSVPIHTHTHSFTHVGILLNHAKKAIWSTSNPGEVTSRPTGFTRSPLSSTKGQNNNIMVSTECLPPSKNISVRVGLTYLFSRIKTQSRVYSDSCCPGAPWRTEGELWRSWPSGTIKRNHQTLSWDRLLTHRSKCLLEIIHTKL